MKRRGRVEAQFVGCGLGGGALGGLGGRAAEVLRLEAERESTVIGWQARSAQKEAPAKQRGRADWAQLVGCRLGGGALGGLGGRAAEVLRPE